MKAGRSFDGAVAALMLAVALLCLRGAYLSATALLSFGDTGAAVRLAIFLVFAAALGFGAWRRWNATQPTQPARATAPLFGREARPRPAPAETRSFVFGAVLALALVTVALDFLVPLRPGSPAVAGDAPPVKTVDPPPAQDTEAPAVVENERPAADTDADVAAEPQTDGAATTDTDKVTEASESPQAQREVPAVAAEAPPGSPAPAVEPPPPAADAEVREEPAPSVPAEAAEPPPQTVAVLPRPVAPPTRPDGHSNSVVWLSVSADGKLLLSAGIDRAIKLWDLAAGRLARDLGNHKDMARAALFMPDGRHALTAGDEGEIVLRALDDGAEVHVFSAEAFGAANQIAISRDGTVAISAHRGGGVVVWDVANRQVRHVLAGHGWPVSSVALSPDGTRAVSGSIEGVLKLWDVGTGRQIREWLGHEKGTYGSAFFADGRRLVTGSGDLTIKLWDVETGEELRRFSGHSRTVYALALSADEGRILSGSLDGTARIWDVETGRELAQFGDNGGSIYAVAFMADGSVLTGARNGTIRRWPAQGGDATILFPAAGK